MFTSWQHRMVAHFDELEARERKGFSEGEAKGRAEGARQNALEIAQKMILRGDSPNSIAEVLDISLDDILALQKTLTPSGT